MKREISGKNRRLTFAIFLFLFPSIVHPQSATDDPSAGGGNPGGYSFQVGGYLRSGFFVDRLGFNDLYAEGEWNLSVDGKRFGSAFAEIRYRTPTAAEDGDRFLIREAYVDFSLGKLDLRLGRQIVVWGRADGFNPTNNITPTDFTVDSPDEDDKRLANFLAKAVYSRPPFTFEMDWVPVYRPSTLPFQEAELPDGVLWGEAAVPAAQWRNGSVGLKLDFEQAAVDASVSWFFGYHKLPGIRLSASSGGVMLVTRPHRTHVIGADFSTSIGRIGLRGEFALSLPEPSGDFSSAVPYPQMEYTLGLDREWGNLNLIVQYIGKHVIGSGDISPQESADLIILWNRMIFSQLKERTHALSVRPQFNVMHDNLRIEFLGFFNFSTREAFLLPKAACTISDAFVLSVGAQCFLGPDHTLYGYMGKKRNAVFAELKFSF